MKKNVLLFAALFLAGAHSVATAANFNFRKTITINQNGGRAIQPNFPFLVSISGDVDLTVNVQSPNGYDIAFTDVALVPLDFEIEYFDRPTGTLLAWVKLPLLQPGPNTIFLNYGDPNVTSPTETGCAVWDGAHVGVWHMGETGNGKHNEYRDSSMFGNHGQGGEGDPLFVPSPTTGPLGFGFGQKFGNADLKWDLIDCGDDASFDITGNQITLEAWIRHNIGTPFAGFQGILNHRGFDFGYRLLIPDQGAVPPSLRFDLPGRTDSVQTVGGITAGAWHHIVATYDGATMKVYVDGVNNPADQRAKTTNILPALREQDFWIGHGDQPKDLPWSYPWDGDIDEVRVSKVARSADWIATEFDNQTSSCFPATGFCGLGAQTTGPFNVNTMAINFRSIGTALGNLSPPGMATTVANSSIVTFSIPLPPHVGQGDFLTTDPGGAQEFRYILLRNSATQVTLQTPSNLSRIRTFTVHRAYNTLQSWEDVCAAAPCLALSGGGRGGDLVGENRREIGVAYDDGDFTSGIVFDGSITDCIHNLTLTVAPVHRHYGLAATGADNKVVLDNGLNAIPAVRIADEFVNVEWLEIKGGDTLSGDGIELSGGIGLPNRTSLRYNLIHDAQGDGIQLNDTDSAVDIVNNIIYNTNFGVNLTMDMIPDTRVNVFNNTIFNNVAGGVETALRQTSVGLDLRNNISHSNVNADFGVAKPFNFAYFCNPVCTQIANGGLVPDANEFLADTANNYTLNFVAGGDYLYLGYPWMFRGVGVVLATAGVGGSDLLWEYWNGLSTSWSSLETGSFHDGTSAFSSSGTVYWANDPVNWAPTMVNGSPALYYVRASLATGAYTTFPIESLITPANVNIASRNNLSGDVTASPHSRFEAGTSGLERVLLGDVRFIDTTPLSENLHILSTSTAEDAASDLSAFFSFDIDAGVRGAAWDIGADEASATTAIELVSFVATAGDSVVELRWETGSEVDNVGFYLYRATSEAGPFEPLNPSMVPGLGSSPLGASYRYVDSGLVNGTTYFYELEDLESTGVRERHGPVSATPLAGASFDLPPDEIEEEDGSSSGEHTITYGNPEETKLRVLKRTRRQVTLELITGGFYAEPQEDGSVRLSIPGFLEDWEPGAPAIPVKRTWLQAVVGRKVKLKSVKAKNVEAFSLRPTSAEMLEPVMLPDGTVSLASSAQPPGKAFRGQGLYPETPVHVVSVAFQGDIKKAFLELSPLRWDRSTGQLLLARRLLVKVKFRGKVPGEKSLGRSRGRKRRNKNAGNGNVVANLVTHDAGLYSVSHRALFGNKRRGIKTRKLNLTYQGEPVAFYVHPNKKQFKRGSRLYFLSGGEDQNPYGREAVYVLSLGGGGQKMERGSASPSGSPVDHYWETVTLEENHLFQGRLVTAPDVWLWDFLLAPVTKAYPFDVQGLASTSESGSLKVWLQGTTNLPQNPDHHVRIYLNGLLLEDFTLEGELPWMGEMSLLPGALVEGQNTLELENVGDTGAAYSRIMLNRFEVTYPRQLVADSGQLHGGFSQSGTAEVTGFTGNALLLDTTGPVTQWLRGAESFPGGLRFRAQDDHHYLLVDSTAVMTPEIRRPFSYRLKSMLYGANYVVIGPESLLEAAWPLLELRIGQGLTVLAVPIEQIYSEFGHGETRPDAIRDFLGYAYHNWRTPPRYVLLLGDGTFDFKDYFGWGVQNQVPPFPFKSTFLWTASDPAYAAVNGDDLLPDIAIGRLPAANLDEAQAMVGKIVAYETEGMGLGGRAVLIADRPDPSAGDFEANAEELAATLLSGHDVEKIYLDDLGAAATHDSILNTFDEGASLVSYIGHGAMNLWSENILRTDDVDSLDYPAHYPLLLTMNCLNGYFQFPTYDSLSETLLKADGKGIIAAFSPSGESLDAPAHFYHRLLLAELLHGGHKTLGDAVLEAQSKFAEAGGYLELLSIYHLFGDPATALR